MNKERPISEGGRVQGAGCRVQGAGCRVQGAGCRVHGAGCRVQGAGCRVQGAGCQGVRPLVSLRSTRCMHAVASSMEQCPACIAYDRLQGLLEIKDTYRPRTLR